MYVTAVCFFFTLFTTEFSAEVTLQVLMNLACLFCCFCECVTVSGKFRMVNLGFQVIV